MSRFAFAGYLAASLVALVGCERPQTKYATPISNHRTPMLSPASIASVALSTEDLCVRLTTGAVLCRKDFRPPSERGEPTSFVPIFDGGDVVEVALGAAHGCVRRSNGAVQCWGGNEGGEVTGYDLLVPWPRTVDISGAASQIALGNARSCAVLIDGHLVCWGTFGGSRRAPGRVAALKEVVEVALNDGNMCVRTRDHVVRCSRGDGYLVAVEGLGKATQLVVGREHACARLSDDTASCWSVRKDDMTKSVLKAIAVSGLTQIKQLASGDAHMCALLQNGAVWCWGSNEYGELGDGTRAGRAAPQPVAKLSDVVQLVSGGRRSCARKTDGAVMCWGRNLLDDAMFHALTGKQSPPGPPGEDDSLVPEPLRVPGTLHVASAP